MKNIFILYPPQKTHMRKIVTGTGNVKTDRSCLDLHGALRANLRKREINTRQWRKEKREGCIISKGIYPELAVLHPEPSGLNSSRSLKSSH